MTTMTKAQFVRELTAVLEGSYPALTDDVIRCELDKAIKGEKPTGIMGMYVVENLKKIKIID